MEKFTTINDKDFKKEVDNVIDKVLFSNFYRPIIEERNLETIKETQTLIEILEKALEEQNDELQGGKITQAMLNEVRGIQERVSIENNNTESHKIEDALYDEITDNFLENPDRYRTYNVKYFQDRINILRVSNLTSDFTEDEKRLQDVSGFKRAK